MRKRKLWFALGLGLALTLVAGACAPGGAPPAEAPAVAETPEAAAETPAAAPEVEDQLEIFSWWTNPGEQDGLFAMYDIFKEEHPNVEIVNATVAGGAGVNAKQVLKTRMLGGDPPDSFQVHLGQELIATWVVAEKMEPLDELYAEQGWRDIFPQDLIDIASQDGQIWSVPVNVHHGNVLWGNAQVLKDNGIEALPTTFDDWFAMAEGLDAAGIPALCLGDKDKWEAAHLFEDVLVGTVGADMYRALFAGEASFDDPKVTEALETMDRMLEFVNEDHAAHDWAGAAQLLVDGKCATMVMGDWAEGFFLAKDWTPNEDFLFAPSPNTEGIFMIVVDSFGLPKGVPHPVNAANWLRVLGSKEGQEAFNPKKGSICARTDCDQSLFDAYLQWSAQDFAQASLTPSLAHGSAAPEAVASAWNDLINNFVTNRDVASAQQALVDAAGDL